MIILVILSMKKIVAGLSGLTTLTQTVMADVGSCGMMDWGSGMMGNVGLGFGYINQILFTIILALVALVLYKMYTKKK